MRALAETSLNATESFRLFTPSLIPGDASNFNVSIQRFLHSVELTTGSGKPAASPIAGG
jgi:hypothetical protein